MLNDLTFCILVKNEADNLLELLPLLTRLPAKIIVFDTGSTDMTVDVVKKYNVSMATVPWSNDFAKVRNTILESVETSWVFMLDADERLTLELEKEVIEILKNNSEINGYYVPRKNHYLGKWLKYGGQYPDYQLKILRKDKAKFTRLVHEKTIVEGKVAYCHNHLLHYPYKTVSRYLRKFDLYSSMEAEILFQSGIRPTFRLGFRWMVIKPFARFLKRFVFKGGFLDGIPGFFAAFFDAVGYVVRFIKLWEMKNTFKNKRIK